MCRSSFTEFHFVSLCSLHPFQLFTVDPMNNGKCEEGYMKCQRNGYCISDTMICNDVANCGENDNSDERDCDSHHRRSTESDCKCNFRAESCKRSLMAWVVVIPKEHRSTFGMTPTWKKKNPQNKKNESYCHTKGRVGGWQRLRPLGTFSHGTAHMCIHNRESSLEISQQWHIVTVGYSNSA